MLHFLKTTFKVFKLYVDFVRDVFLIAALINIVSVATFREPDLRIQTTFGNHVIWFLILASGIPIVVFGVHVARKWPYLVLGFETSQHYQKEPMGKFKLLLFRIFLVVFSLFVPALLIYVKEAEKENAENFLLEASIDEKNLEKARESQAFSEQVDVVLLDFKKGELSMEIPVELIIQTFLVLLFFSKTSTKGGFEALFRVDKSLLAEPLNLTSYMEKYESQNYLSGVVGFLDYKLEVHVGPTTLMILSIIWSFMTARKTYIEMKRKESGFLDFEAKQLLGFRAFWCMFTKVACITIYFMPTLGFFDMMAHWQSEQFELITEKEWNANDNFSCYNAVHENITTLRYGHLYRKNGTYEPDQSLYTTTELWEAYSILWAICILHMVVLVSTKICLSKKYRNETFINKLRKALLTVAIPDIVSNWDDGIQDQETYRKRWKKNMIEITFMILIQWVFNVVVVVPTILTVPAIREREALIIDCIGVFAEETYSLHVMTHLQWIIPLVITIAHVLDWGLYYIWMNKIHPWIGLIQQEEEEEDASDDIGDEDESRETYLLLEEIFKEMVEDKDDGEEKKEVEAGEIHLKGASKLISEDSNCFEGGLEIASQVISEDISEGGLEIDEVKTIKHP